MHECSCSYMLEWTERAKCFYTWKKISENVLFCLCLSEILETIIEKYYLRYKRLKHLLWVKLFNTVVTILDAACKLLKFSLFLSIQHYACLLNIDAIALYLLSKIHVHIKHHSCVFSIFIYSYLMNLLYICSHDWCNIQST